MYLGVQPGRVVDDPELHLLALGIDALDGHLRRFSLALGLLLHRRDEAARSINPSTGGHKYTHASKHARIKRAKNQR